MLRVVSSEDEPPYLDGFGFWHDVNDVFDACNLMVASKYRILPSGTCWEDMDEDWADDIKTWLALYYYAQWEADPKRGGGDDVLSGFLNEAGSAPDVDELFHG